MHASIHTYMFDETGISPYECHVSDVWGMEKRKKERKKYPSLSGLDPFTPSLMEGRNHIYMMDERGLCCNDVSYLWEKGKERIVLVRPRSIVVRMSTCMRTYSTY